MPVEILLDRFPSPGGDYGLSDGDCPEDERAFVIVFPSPGGDWGLSDYHFRRPNKFNARKFPSPGGD